jgi:hypothetical protein
MDVVFKPVNNTVWMEKNELCELFGCYMKDVDLCIGDIFEKDVFRIEDTCRYYVIAGSKRISYDITAVNLKVIIAMAFRLAKILRIWFVEQFSKTIYPDITVLDIGEKFRWN